MNDILYSLVYGMKEAIRFWTEMELPSWKILGLLLGGSLIYIFIVLVVLAHDNQH